jgi:DNA integrity scanning protein DisA with diadenylate cyclase activity
MVVLHLLGTTHRVASHVWIESGVEVIQSDEKAGVIVRRKTGDVYSCQPQSLFTNEGETRQAVIEFYKDELAKITEAYEKKIAELASVG